MTSTDTLKAVSAALPNQESLMPAIFVGHGSPMNAIEENEFTRGWKESVRDIPRPKAIICISAHWLTRGTRVTAMKTQRTIHDFGGFPPELYAVQYPAPGDPAVAQNTADTITATRVTLDQQWGLDHGAWSVVKHMYPDANVPMLELSIDYTRDARYHYALGQELAAMRAKGILIIGSGNMVHNLGMIDWRNEDKGFDWAIEMNETFKRLIADGNHSALIEWESLGAAARLAIPSLDHYLPLLYVLAMQSRSETASFFNDKAVMGSLTMTSLKIGAA